ncbi:non-classical export protein Nce102 [Polychaeton citri CBS 116435]|uniref:Non-classical export protein Nce102 n=1 Tax=Polychaeton citri CBS 116435 TaxID=1314669 RepID=A0A9P4QGU4_9PEZI|nr:non-classical export protein Nce102 [Polychaeton citri CBS 116435]
MGLGKPVNLAMRGLQFLWTLLTMSLIGNVIAEYRRGSPSLINYDMFVAAFSMLTLFYLIPATLKEGWAIHPVLPLVLDLLNTIFTFCAAVAMAAELRVHSCGNDSYVARNKLIRGSSSPHKSCREQQASTAFLWFAFAAFLVSTVISGMATGGGANLGARGVRRSGPAMSQV